VAKSFDCGIWCLSYCGCQSYGYAPDFDSIEDLVNYHLDRSRKHLEHAHEELFQQEAFTVCEHINYVKRWWGEE
jgi:hypothetical protein